MKKISLLVYGLILGLISINSYAKNLEVYLNDEKIYQGVPKFMPKEDYVYFDLDISDKLISSSVDRIFNKEISSFCLYNLENIKDPKELFCKPIKQDWLENISVFYSGNFELESKIGVLSIAMPQKRTDKSYHFDLTEMILSFPDTKNSRVRSKIVAEFSYILKDTAQLGDTIVLHLDSKNKISFKFYE